MEQILANSPDANKVAKKARAHWEGSSSQVAINTDPSDASFYLWSDLPLGSRSQNVVETFKRLRAMALGYAMPGSVLAGDTDLATAVADGLDWMTENVFSTSATDPYLSWYDWEIASPQALNDTAVLITQY
jgi:hyaluronate lyase